MVAIKDMLNVGRVANPAEYIEQQLAKTAEWGFPYVPLIEVDSAFAEALLARNALNRPLRDRRAMRYREDMAAGRWTPGNGEAIVITLDGLMVSGQHRCQAIAGTDLVVPMFVAFGVPHESYKTVDQGAPKTAGDFLTMQGEGNGATIAKIARLRIAYEANEREAIRDTAKPTNAEVLDYFDANKGALEASSDLAIALREYTKPIAAPSVVGFVHNVLHDIEGEQADRYIDQVAKGEDIKEGDPAFAVRTRLLNMGKTGAAKKAGVMFTGWNAFRQGRILKTIRIADRLPLLV